MLTAEAANRVAERYYGGALKPCQAEIMAGVLDMTIPRLAILGATQIEKSRAAARALGILASIGVGITVVGPKMEQAITPLQYFIGLMGNNAYFQSLMLQGGENTTERLQASESKTFLSFKGGGFIKAITLNENDSEQKQRSALGKGSQVVVFEEASLTANVTEALVLRMVAGWGYKGRIIKLGNAITREQGFDHFYKSTLGEHGYKVITVDYHRALAEGIYTPEFIAEAITKPLFEQLYACHFPEPSQYLPGGYLRLFKDETLNKAVNAAPAEYGQPGSIGIDVGEGSPDETVVVGRNDSYAWPIARSSNPDVLQQVYEYEPYLRPFKKSVVIYIDSIGVGAGPASLLKSMGYTVRSVRAGESSPEAGYRDIKAFAYFKVEEWARNGGILAGSGKWLQFREVAYKTNSDKNVFIESKEELRARKVPSYNDAEALMLTFAVKRSTYQPGQISVG